MYNEWADTHRQLYNMLRGEYESDEEINEIENDAEIMF